MQKLIRSFRDRSLIQLLVGLITTSAYTLTKDPLFRLHGYRIDCWLVGRQLTKGSGFGLIGDLVIGLGLSEGIGLGTASNLRALPCHSKLLLILDLGRCQIGQLLANH